MRANTIVFAALLCGAGCPADGECEYGDNTPETVSVTIAAIEGDASTGWEVRVEGDVEFTFELRDDAYQRCVAGPGLSVGDPTEVEVLDGGPCPPQHSLGDCEGYS